MPSPVGLNLTDHVSEAGKRSGARRDGQGEGTPTLAQEEPQTGLPSSPCPAACSPSSPGRLHSGPALSGLGGFFW